MSDVSDREYIEALFKERDRAVKVASEEREKAAAALREQLSERIAAGDTQLREHIQTQVEQLRQMVANSTDISQIRFEASQAAIQKAEQANEKRFEQTNEWRAQSQDRERTQQETMAKLSGTYLPREVAETQNEATNKRLTALEVANRYDEGKARGVGMSTTALVSTLGVVLTVVTIIIILANVATGK